MSYDEIPAPKQIKDEPTLSELLAEEVRTKTDIADTTSTDVTKTNEVTLSHAPVDELDANELPNKIVQLLSAATFAEPVREEVDWLIADRALLPVTTRARMLAGVDRALKVRRAEETVQQAPETLFTDVPDEFADLTAELQDILNSVEHHKIRPSNFSPARVVELVRGATIDPVIAFAACRRSIRSAQEIGSKRVGILGRHAEDDWENRLRELRLMLLGSSDPSSTGPSDPSSTDERLD
jgi:hypothetical protein